MCSTHDMTFIVFVVFRKVWWRNWSQENSRPMIPYGTFDPYIPPLRSKLTWPVIHEMTQSLRKKKAEKKPWKHPIRYPTICTVTARMLGWFNGRFFMTTRFHNVRLFSDFGLKCILKSLDMGWWWKHHVHILQAWQPSFAPSLPRINAWQQEVQVPG